MDLSQGYQVWDQDNHLAYNGPSELKKNQHVKRLRDEGKIAYWAAGDGKVATVKPSWYLKLWRRFIGWIGRHFNG